MLVSVMLLTAVTVGARPASFTYTHVAVHLVLTFTVYARVRRTLIYVCVYKEQKMHRRILEVHRNI